MLSAHYDRHHNTMIAMTTMAAMVAMAAMIAMTIDGCDGIVGSKHLRAYGAIHPFAKPQMLRLYIDDQRWHRRARSACIARPIRGSARIIYTP
jgi:hypothetical protein